MKIRHIDKIKDKYIRAFTIEGRHINKILNLIEEAAYTGSYFINYSIMDNLKVIDEIIEKVCQNIIDEGYKVSSELTYESIHYRDYKLYISWQHILDNNANNK